MSNLQPTPEAEIDTLLFAYAEAVAATYQRYADGEIKTAKNAMELTLVHQELKQALADLLNRSRIEEAKWAKQQFTKLDKSHLGSSFYTRNTAFKNYAVKFWNNRVGVITAKFDKHIAELQTPPATEEVAG